MEANALYLTAARLGKQELAICSISDEVLKGVELSSDERQVGFNLLYIIDIYIYKTEILQLL